MKLNSFPYKSSFCELFSDKTPTRWQRLSVEIFLKIFMKLKKLEENFTFFSQLDDSVLGFEMK